MIQWHLGTIWVMSSPREIAQSYGRECSSISLPSVFVDAEVMARAIVEIDGLLRQLDELDSAANHEDFEVAVNGIAAVLDGEGE